ncbi:hypothetical protein DPX16_19034 [Anabarilius grahami]|uniref:Uncharacterized protein n=1 Tax=Anabarilius grahami TaxID=495550 RepID=A0A3N0YW54_ANAGA|nr:hypothetical protein DPX16_19034 [Anabarilius grahami]
MRSRTLANHFGLRLIHVYVKRRALSNNSLLRNSVGHLSASGQLSFHHAERIPQGAFTEERLQRMPVSQAAALNARLTELVVSKCLPVFEPAKQVSKALNADDNLAGHKKQTPYSPRKHSRGSQLEKIACVWVKIRVRQKDKTSS